MQQPYGSGLWIPPDGFLPKMRWWAQKALRKADRVFMKPLDRLGLGKLRMTKLIHVRDRIGSEVQHYTVLHQAHTVSIARASDNEFLQRVKHYGSGTLNLPEVFVCEVSPARYYPYLGLVANDRFEVFLDSVLLAVRFELSPAYRSFFPRHVEHRTGLASTIQRIDSNNFWHWFADCLPQVLTLERYLAGRPLTLLISDHLGGFQRDTLSRVVPPNMRIEVVPTKRWLSFDRFLLPSYLSGRCNGYIEPGYYDEIRRRLTASFGLPENAPKRRRVYLSRAGAKKRRIGNETALMEMLSRYGFECVRPELMSMRDQIEMFQQSEIIAGPHGAGLGGMVFAPGARLLVLYSEPYPSEYFYTMSRCVGVEHFAVIHDINNDEDYAGEFPVDLERIEAMLTGPMGLTPQTGGAVV